MNEAGGEGLEIGELLVRFGGLVAVDHVSLRAPLGVITGLIGPNGAGKTTVFNACAGVVPAAGGTIRLTGRVLGKLRPAARARAGLGRTFQRMELFDTMTVRENVRLGLEARLAGKTPWGQLWSSPSERNDVAGTAEKALEQCGIGDLADRRAGALSTGERRMVELARAMACSFRVLLLDEPSSGLDVAETEHFGAVLESYVAEYNVGILLIEHDMALVRRVCETVYVLEFGRMLFTGPTHEALASDKVRAAYLGSEAVA